MAPALEFAQAPPGARRRLFSAWVRLSRALPAFRGKVRLGLAVCHALGLDHDRATLTAALFEERLRFRLDMGCLHERMALLMNQYEDAATTLLARLYRGGRILDIGANIGLVALPLAARTRERAEVSPHLHAFEALESNFAVLSGNIALNALQPVVEAHRALLGASHAPVAIEVEGGDFGRTGTANVVPGRRSESARSEAASRLDEWMERLRGPRVDLVKLDTDGYDYEILKGAEALLRRDRPVVFAELERTCLSWHGQTALDVAAFVSGLGYETWAMCQEYPMRFRPLARGGPTQRDYLLVPHDRVPSLAWLLS